MFVILHMYLLTTVPCHEIDESKSSQHRHENFEHIFSTDALQVIVESFSTHIQILKIRDMLIQN